MGRLRCHILARYTKNKTVRLILLDIFGKMLTFNNVVVEKNAMQTTSRSESSRVINEHESSSSNISIDG
uniref:Uncharacterized protein n=1 Tax=Salix viminalis TaxID=40686 RepID=A0A6N2KTI5_SALVM